MLRAIVEINHTTRNVPNGLQVNLKPRACMKIEGPNSDELSLAFEFAQARDDGWGLALGNVMYYPAEGEGVDHGHLSAEGLLTVLADMLDCDIVRRTPTT